MKKEEVLIIQQKRRYLVVSEFQCFLDRNFPLTLILSPEEGVEVRGHAERSEAYLAEIIGHNQDVHQ